MTINRAINTAIEFCKEGLVPSTYTIKTTALYALGGFLSGRVFGFVSPMHGAIYLAASRITYVAINRMGVFTHRLACNTTKVLEKKIRPEPEYSQLGLLCGRESSFSSYVRNGRRLVSSWMCSLRESLGFIRGMPLNYMNVYLSHHMANAAALSLLKIQPIAYRTAIKVACSSVILTIFAGSIYGFYYERSWKSKERSKS